MPRYRNKLPTGLIGAISLIVAMALRILPLPQPWVASNPDWVLLFLIYWTLAAPERIGLGAAWLTGLLADVLTARALGQYALAYTLVAYLCLRLHQRWQLYPLTQQSLFVGLLLLLSQFFIFWTQEIEGSRLVEARYWLLPALTGAIAWPPVSSTLRYLHRGSSR